MKLKIFTLSFLFSLSLSFSNAQCEIINGSYEEWVTSDFVLSDGNNSEVSSEVLLPEGTAPFIRLFLLSFAAIFDPSYALFLESDAQGLTGMSQSTDASEGDFALKLQSGFGVEVADVYSVNACTDLPGQFNFDIKHFGTSNDTLSVFVIFDQGLNAVPQSEEELANFPAYASTQMIFNSDTEYETISLPVIQNFEAPIDTFYYLIATESLDSTSYFLIDNLNFDDENSGCMVQPTTITMVGIEGPICLCLGLDVNLLLEYTKEQEYQYNELIVDENGTIISIDFSEPGIHSEFCSSSDNLNVVVLTYEGELEGLFTGSNISDLVGCFELSNSIALETTTFPEFEFNVFLNGVQQDDNITLCLLDDLIETFTFSTDIVIDNVAIFLINNDTDRLELRIDNINDTTTFPDIEPGEYVLAAVGYDVAFNLEVGQVVEDITFDGCFYVPEDQLAISVLGPDDNCTTNVEEIYTGALSLRPSFSNGIFLIHNPNHEEYQYELRDIHGKSFFIDKNNSSSSESLDLTDFPNGIYIVSFFIEGQYHQEKIVKL